MKPELIVNQASTTAECPLWHPKEQVLYWIDIPNAKLFRFDPATAKVDTFDTGTVTGGITLQEDESLLLFMAKGAIKVWRNGTIETTIINSIPRELDSRFNDVIADPAGRVFCGTMSSSDHAGILYRLDPDLALIPVADNIGTSNGIAFSPDHKFLYHTDTRKHTIYRYNYDKVTGEITNPIPFIVVNDGPSRPDGLTVDSEGNLWSARWEGYGIVKYAPDGTELERIPLPALKVSSLTFGGETYNDLYITTAGGDDRTANGSTAGSLFRIKCPVPGIPEFRSKIKLNTNK